MLRLAFAFSGPSNSGKTTLIEKLAKVFQAQGLKVVILKHDPANKAKFDTPGKDSFKFFQSGADTIVLSPTQTSFFKHGELSLEECFKLANAFDIFLVEGLKSLDLPRLSVFCGALDESYFDFSLGIASYEKPKVQGLKWLFLDDIEQIAKFVLENAKKV